MSWQWKWIDRFNAWYDGLEPVPRLIAFLVATALASVKLSIAEEQHGKALHLCEHAGKSANQHLGVP